MHAVYIASVAIHVLAAMVWVGGQAAFALVVVPSVRRELDGATRAAVIRRAGTRFAAIAWVCLGVLAATGIANLALLGLFPHLASATFWRTPFGTTLAIKVSIVGGMVAATVLHAWHARRSATTGDDDGARRWARILGRTTLVLSIVVVLLAVTLTRGAP